MEWLALVLVMAAVVAVAWFVTQKSPDDIAAEGVRTLAIEVGGTHSGVSLYLQFREMPAEGTVRPDRRIEREGRVVRLIKGYVWAVKLTTPDGSRAAYYPMQGPDDLPDGATLLMQLAQLAEAERNGQG